MHSWMLLQYFSVWTKSRSSLSFYYSRWLYPSFIYVVYVVRVSKNAHLFCNLNIFSCFFLLLIIAKQNKTKVYCWVTQLENMWCILHIWCRYILLLHTVCTWKSRLHSFIHHLLIFQWDFRSLKWLNKTMNFHFEYMVWKHKEGVRIVRNSIVLLFEMKKQPRIGKQNEHWNELNWLKIQWMNARNRNCVGKTLKVSKNRINSFAKSTMNVGFGKMKPV